MDILKRVAVGLGALVLAIAPSPLAAKVLLTQDEALRLAFAKGAAVERRTAFLGAPELERAKALAGAPVPNGVVTYYVAKVDGREAGRAYFDSHLVRTLPETVMVVVESPGVTKRIEVLSFSEPADYLPRAHWYEQFAGKKLDDELSLKRAVRPVTGATLTAKATTEAARRVLALDAVIRESEAAAAPRAPEKR